MAYDIYGNRLKRGHCEVHPDIPEPFPCYRCIEERRGGDYPPEPYPEYTEEDICTAANHAYFGDDDDGGRCYCGQKRYPRGGPMEHDNQTFKAVFGEFEAPRAEQEREVAAR